MSSETPVPAEQVIRVVAPFGSLASLLRNRDKLASGSIGKLTPNDLTVVNGRGICRQWSLVAGLPVDHGEVANEAAMLALHVDSAETPTPRWVVPGDSCTRADDPDWRWHCIAGNGTQISNWERRPLAGALSGLAVSGHTHAISAVTGLQTALDGKQPASAVLSDLSDVDGALAYKGAVIAGGGGSSELWQAPWVQLWYDTANRLPLGVNGIVADAGAIVALGDLSRYGRAVRQPTAGNRPTWSAAENAIKFASGTSQYLAAPTMSPYDTALVGDLTLYVLARRSTASGTCLFCGSAADNNRVNLYWEAGTLRVIAGTPGYADFTYTPTTDWTLLEIRWRGTTATLYANGVLVGTATGSHTHTTSAWSTWKLGVYTDTLSIDLYLRALVLLDAGASDAYCDSVRAALLP